MNLKSILCGLCFTFLAFSASAQSDKISDIKALMVSTGMSDMAKQMAGQVINMQKQNNPDVPAEFWDKFMAEMNMDELMDLMVPIYDKYYTQEEIKGLTEFYQTELGKKTISVMPSLMQESMVAGQQWGMKLGQRVADQIQAGKY